MLCFDEIVEILNLKIPKTPKNIADLLPETEDYLTFKGLTIPLYGGLISGEVEIFNQYQQKLERITRAYQNIVREIKAPSTYSDAEVISCLKTNTVENIVYHYNKVDFNELGFEEIERIAKERGLTFFSETITEGDDTVQNVVEKYYDTWVKNGYTGQGITIINEILNKIEPIVIDGVESQEIDGEAIVKRSGLTWNELEAIPSFLSLTLPYLAVIKFRTGVGSYDMFSYMRPEELVEVTMILEEEFQSEKFVAVKEPIHQNPNVEVTKNENGEQENEDDSVEGKELKKSTTTKSSRRLKVVKEKGND